MNVLGYKYGVWKKDVYIDGHERADVVEYRKCFLKRMLPRLNRMKWWEGDEMTICVERMNTCLLYTSPSPRDLSTSRMPSSA